MAYWEEEADNVGWAPPVTAYEKELIDRFEAELRSSERGSDLGISGGYLTMEITSVNRYEVTLTVKSGVKNDVEIREYEETFFLSRQTYEINGE